MTDSRKVSDQDPSPSPGGQFLPPPEIPEVLRQPSKVAPTVRPSALGSAMGDIGKPLAIGIDFLSTIGAAGLIGWGLDRWLGWKPYGLVGGIAVGFVAGTIRLIQRLARDDARGK